MHDDLLEQYEAVGPRDGPARQDCVVRYTGIVSLAGGRTSIQVVDQLLRCHVDA